MEHIRIGILGGGISGLTSAYYLARAGYKPVVLEPGGDLGDLGPVVEHDGLFLERLPHSIQNTDTAVCGLLAELGALGRLTWRPTETGIIVERELRPMNESSDLLGLSSLGGAARTRGWLGLHYATRLHGYALHLNEVRAVDWLPRIFGRAVFEELWRPYLEQRFNGWADDVAAYPIWRDLNHAHRPRPRSGGYIRGGPRWLTEKLRRSIEELGGEIRLHADLSAIEASGANCSIEVDGRPQRFDAVIATLPPAQLDKLARGALARRLAASYVPYQGRVVTLAVLRRQLSSYHNTLVFDETLPFQNIEEATRVIPSRQCGGKHLIYLTQNCEPSSDSFKVPDDVVRKQVVEDLPQCFPGFTAADIEMVQVTRIEQAAAVFTVEALKNRPDVRVEGTNVFLATPAQAHARAPGWDSQITQAREISGAIRALIGH